VEANPKSKPHLAGEFAANGVQQCDSKVGKQEKIMAARFGKFVDTTHLPTADVKKDRAVSEVLIVLNECTERDKNGGCDETSCDRAVSEVLIVLNERTERDKNGGCDETSCDKPRTTVYARNKHHILTVATQQTEYETKLVCESKTDGSARPLRSSCLKGSTAVPNMARSLRGGWVASVSLRVVSFQPISAVVAPVTHG
jgi:hypothetical protein